MQYAGAEGLIVWVIIIVISIVYRAIKASGGSVAMPPKQKGQQHPRQSQRPRPQVPHPMPVLPNQAGAVPRQAAFGGVQSPIPQQEIERAHQELQSEFEQVFAQVPHSSDVAYQAQQAGQSQYIQTQDTPRHERQAHHDIPRYAAGKSSTAVQVSPAQGLHGGDASQYRLRLRQAYLLTELIGRPRAYDI